MGVRVLLVVNRKARQGEAAHADAVRHLTALGFEVIDGSQRGCGSAVGPSAAHPLTTSPHRG